MTEPTNLCLDIAPFWQSLQADLLRIVDLIPDDKLNWTPKADLWNARGILIHVSDVRDVWLTKGAQDGEPYPNIWQTARSKVDLKRELGRTFERLMRFLTNTVQMDATHPDPGDLNGTPRVRSGHWLAFQLLEHDIHHRAELLQRLALLDIAHGVEL